QEWRAATAGNSRRTGADLPRAPRVGGGGGPRHAAPWERRCPQPRCALGGAGLPPPAALAAARQGAGFDRRPGRRAVYLCPRRARPAAPAWPPLVAYTIGTETEVSDPDGNWQQAYGIDADGAVLIRPDGYVAWRSASSVSNPEAALRAAFDRLLGRVAAMA